MEVIINIFSDAKLSLRSSMGLAAKVLTGIAIIGFLVAISLAINTHISYINMVANEDQAQVSELKMRYWGSLIATIGIAAISATVGVVGSMQFLQG